MSTFKVEAPPPVVEREISMVRESGLPGDRAQERIWMLRRKGYISLQLTGFQGVGLVQLSLAEAAELGSQLTALSNPKGTE